MDELIILIIKGIIKLFGGDTDQKRRPAGRGPQSIERQSWQQRTLQQPSLPPALAAAIASLQQPNRGGRAPKAGKRRRQVPPIALPVPPIAAEVGEIVEMVPPPAIARHGSGAKAAASSANAIALRAWLTPAGLRKQFVITEILQPPLALREKW